MKTDAVAQLLGPVVERCGLEIDRIETMNAGKRVVLRIFLDGDGPAGHGPSLDEIAEATRAVSRVLDESPVTGERPYVLEVSSRGVSRPLTQARHYRRNQGRLVALTLADAPDVTGRIVTSDEDSVTIEVGDTLRDIAYEVITRAVVQAELTKGGDDDLGDEVDDAADDEEE